MAMEKITSYNQVMNIVFGTGLREDGTT